MTFVLALGNSDQIVQISDRRLTDERGSPCLLPENKATILTLADSRLLVGFAGLARAGRFRTGQWILDTLLKAARDDHLGHNTIERFASAATQRFLKPDIQAIPMARRGLSVLFTGYADSQPPPNLVFVLVSNFQNFETGRDEPPWSSFRTFHRTVKPGVPAETVTCIQRIGTWVAMDDERDVQRLRQILEAHQPVRAITDAGVGIVRSIAARDAAEGYIGSDLTSSIIPAARPSYLDRGEFPVQMGYHPQGTSHKLFGPNQVISLPGSELALMDPVFGPENKCGARRPIAVQKVGRNKPCPCGSGKKYKRCHGR